MKRKQSKIGQAKLDKAYLSAMSTGEPESDEDEVTVDTAWGIMVLKVSPDARRVILKSVISKDDQQPVTPEQMLEGLQGKGIKSGVRAEALVEVSQAAHGPAGWRGQVVVAKATEPRGAVRVTYPCAESVGPFKQVTGRWVFEKEAVSFADISTALNASSVDQMFACKSAALAVRPGQILTELDGLDEQEAGTNVYGGVIEPDVALGPEQGENVSGANDGNRLESQIFGYVMFQGDKISVLPPIWVSDDRMVAHYVHFNQIDVTARPTKSDIDDALTRSGVSSGVIEQNIIQLCDYLEKGQDVGRSVVLARGRESIDGTDAYLAFEFEIDERAGEVLVDGSIDLRERNLIHNVAKGDLIGRKVAATLGEPGERIDGSALEASDGKDFEPRAGKGATLKENGADLLAYAEIDGCAKYKNNTVSVEPVLRIAGDVNFETGNVTYDQDVFVTGSVVTGFSVSAGGDLNIGGTVEYGATVRSLKDLTVGKGILGETTTAVALGDLKAQFIQNATVLVRGNILVGSYVHNATVRCGGEVKIEKGGGERGGTITGGRVFATKKIEVSRVGSHSTSGTEIGIQAAPDVTAKLNKVTAGLKTSDQQITKIMRSLGLRSVDPASIQGFLNRVPPAKKTFYLELLSKLNDLAKFKRSCEAEKNSLESSISKVIASGRISISEKLFGGVRVHFGSEESFFREDRGSTELVWNSSEISVKESSSDG